VQDVNDLIQRLIDMWTGMKQSVSDMSLTSGADVSLHACEPQEDIFNIYCDIN